MAFYDPDTAPEVFDIVWCKWPRREDKMQPGPWVRPVLVLDVRPMVFVPTNTPYALVTAAYGTGFENASAADLKAGHPFVTNKDAEAHGLNKATMFKLDVGNRKALPWADQYFVPQEYVQNKDIIAGQLSADRIKIAIAYFERNGLTFPLPR